MFEIAQTSIKAWRHIWIAYYSNERLNLGQILRDAMQEILANDAF